MNLKRCEKCDGKKEFQGIGYMIVKCKDCKGIGYKSEDKEPEKIIKKERKKRTLKNADCKESNSES